MARKEGRGRGGDLADLCEAVVGQQEVLASLLDVLTKGAAPEPHVLPMWESDPDPASVTPEVPIVLKHLRTAHDVLVTALASERMAQPVAGGHLVTLQPPVPDRVREAVTEAWRRSKVAAITLVEMHGSDHQQERLYKARQRAPAGSPVVVINPLRAGVRPPVGEMPADAQRPAQRPAVLVVDDEPDLLDSLQAYLSEHAPDVEIITAASGSKALEVLHDRPVALIISDLRMPGMDGISFLEKAKDLSPEARRLLLTAYSGPEVEDRAKSEAEVEAVLHKPGALPELLDLLKQVEDKAKKK